MHVINLAERGLHQAGRRLFGAKVAVMGLAYKKNINDPRESPAIKIIERPRGQGAGLRPVRPLACDEGRGVRLGRVHRGGAHRCGVCGVFGGP